MLFRRLTRCLSPVLPALAFLLLFAPPHAGAADRLGTAPVRFMSVAEGVAALTARDDFVRHLSPFDRAARLRTDHVVSESEYLAFVGRSVTPWPDDERARIETALHQIEPALSNLAPALSDPVLLIRTTGDEEGHAAYTRGDAIVLPQTILASSAEELARTLAHESFHLLSRRNPRLREQLYAAIGYYSCGEISLPDPLKPSRITNPDAPRIDHCIRVRHGGAFWWAASVLYADPAQYDPRRGGEFFDYLQFRLMLIAQANATGPAAAIHLEPSPAMASPAEVDGFYEQIGRNTDYIIHPEEILADNFALLVMNQTGPSPAISARLRAILTQTEAR